MKALPYLALAVTVLCGCTTTTTASDIVLLKTQVGPAHCAAAVNGDCASCETACPPLNQALCIGGTSTPATPGAAAACVKPASCTCVARTAVPVPPKADGS